MPGAQRKRAIPGGPAWVPGPHRQVPTPQCAERGGGPRGLPRPRPGPAPRAAASVRGGGSCAPAPSRTSFVIASPPFPPSASPTSAGPPSAPHRAEERSRGPHTGGHRAEAPQPALAGRLDAGAEQGSRPEEENRAPACPPHCLALLVSRGLRHGPFLRREPRVLRHLKGVRSGRSRHQGKSPLGPRAAE